MEKIEEQLNKEIHVTKEEAQERYDFQIDGILSWHKNPKNKDRRSVEQVKKDTMNSCICEAAVAAFNVKGLSSLLLCSAINKTDIYITFASFFNFCTNSATLETLIPAFLFGGSSTLV